MRAAKLAITIPDLELFVFLLMSLWEKQFQLGYRQYLKWNRVLIFSRHGKVVRLALARR